MLVHSIRNSASLIDEFPWWPLQTAVTEQLVTCGGLLFSRFGHRLRRGIQRSSSLHHFHGAIPSESVISSQQPYTALPQHNMASKTAPSRVVDIKSAGHPNQT